MTQTNNVVFSLARGLYVDHGESLRSGTVPGRRCHEWTMSALPSKTKVFGHLRGQRECLWDLWRHLSSEPTGCDLDSETAGGRQETTWNEIRRYTNWGTASVATPKWHSHKYAPPDFWVQEDKYNHDVSTDSVVPTPTLLRHVGSPPSTQIPKGPHERRSLLPGGWPHWQSVEIGPMTSVRRKVKENGKTDRRSYTVRVSIDDFYVFHGILLPAKTISPKLGSF